MADNPYETAIDELDAAGGPGGPVPSPAADPYEAALDAQTASADDVELQKDRDIADLFKRAQLDMPVDRRAGVLALTKASGLKSLAVELNYDRLKASYDVAHGPGYGVFDARGWRKANPEAAKWLLERPQDAPVVMRDPGLSVVSQALNKINHAIFTPYVAEGIPNREARLADLERQREGVMIKPTGPVAMVDDEAAKLLREGDFSKRVVIPYARYVETKQRLDISKKQFDLMRQRLLGNDSYEAEKELLDLKREAVQRDFGESALGQVASDVATASASTVDVAKQGGAAGLAGAAVSGLAALAITRSPAAATNAALRGGAFFGKGGAALGTFQLEAGDAYGELLEAKTDDGKPVSHEVAAGAALSYGILAAGIEFASWGPMLKSMGPLGELIRRGEKKAALEAMVKDPTFRVMAKRVAKNWLAASAAEGGEESLQTWAQDIANYFARSYEQGQLQKTSTAAVKESLEKGFMAGQKGLIGGGLGIGAGAVGVDVLTQQMLRERSEVSQQQVQAVSNLAGSPTVTASPEAAAAIVAGATEGGQKATHAYVDGPALVRLAEKQQVDPKALATQLFGEKGPQMLADALDAGGRIEVPMADWVTVADNEAAKALLPDVTFGPELLTRTELDALEIEDTEAAEASRAGEAVRQDFEGAGAAAQLNELYGDENTGLLNERGYELAPIDPERQHEAVFELEGQKFFNDLEHDYTVFDAALRRAATTLRAEVPDAARVGGAMKARVKSEAHAKSIAKKLTKALGGKLRVTVAAGKEQARSQGEFAHRGSPPIAFLQQGEHQAFGRAEAARQAGQDATPEDAALTKAALERAGKDTEQLRGEMLATPAAAPTSLLEAHTAAAAKLQPGEAGQTVNYTPEGLHTALGWKRLRRVAKKAHVAFADARGFGDMRKALLDVLGPERGNAAMDELASAFFSAVRQALDGRDDGARMNPKGDELLAQTDDQQRLNDTFEELRDRLNDEVFFVQGADGRVFVQQGLQFAHAFGTDEKAAGAAVEELKRGQVVRKPRVVTAAEWAELRAALPRQPRELGVDQGVGRAAGPGRQGGGGSSTGGSRGSGQEVASDADVEQAKQTMGLQPMFRTAAQAGMSAEQWQAYLDAQEQATRHGARAAELRAAKDKLRKTSAEYKEAEAKERATAEADYELLPGRQALLYLRGKHPDAALPISLDRAAVEAIVGPEAARLPTRADGVQPDEVSEALGYPTGADLVRDIASLRPKAEWVRQTVAARMLEKFPDMVNSRQELRDVVAQGLHGKYGKKWLLAELEALAAQPFTFAFNPEANQMQAVRNELLGKPEVADQDARRRAAEITANQAIGRLSPAMAQRLERTAGADALAASTQGNYARAFVLKLKQLLNLHRFNELTEAVQQRDGFYKLAAELGDPKARGELAKASKTYADGVDLVLEAIGLKAPEARDQPLASVGDVVREFEADGGSTVMFDEDMVAGLVAKPKPFRELTVAEMREVDTFLRNVKAAARVKNEAIAEGVRADRQNVVAELQAEAEANRKAVGPVTSSESAESALEVLSRGWTEFDGSGLRPETLARWLGGDKPGSAWQRWVVEPLQKAKHVKAELLKKVIAPLLPKFDAVIADNRMMKPVDSKALFPTHRKDLEAPTRVYELFMMALHAGTKSSLDRLLQGRGINEEQLVAALDKHLWPKAIELVQAIWDANETLWPLAKALEERQSGVAPPKLEPRPLKTKHGELRGGYMAAKYDARVEQVGELQAGEALSAVLDQSYVRPGTAKSHLKKRAENFSGALQLEPGLIMRVLDQAAHDIAYREPLRSVAGLIWDPKLQRTLRERLGTGRASQFKQWLRDVGTQAGGNLNDIWSRAGRAIKKRTVQAALAYRLPTALGDLTNFMLGARRLGPGAMLGGITEFFSNPKAAIRFAYENSGELSSREGGMLERFKGDLDLMTKRGGKLRRFAEQFDRHGFTIYEWTEKFFAVPAWLGAYRKAQAEGKSQAEAKTFADSMVRRMLPAWNPVDQAAIQRNRYLSPFLMFSSWHNVMWNEIRSEWEPVFQAMGMGDAAKKAAIAIPATLFMLFSSYVVTELVSGRGPDPDDGEDAAERFRRWMARKMFVGSMLPLPVIGPELGPFVESTLMHKRTTPRGGLYTSIINPLIAAGANMLNGDKGAEDKFFALMRAVAPLIGKPTYPLVPAKYLLDTAQGETDPRGAGDVIGGLGYGAREGQGANVPTLIQDALE